MSALKFQVSAILVEAEKTAMEMRNTFHSHRKLTPGSHKNVAPQHIAVDKISNDE